MPRWVQWTYINTTETYPRSLFLESQVHHPKNSPSSALLARRTPDRIRTIGDRPASGCCCADICRLSPHSTRPCARWLPVTWQGATSQCQLRELHNRWPFARTTRRRLRPIRKRMAAPSLLSTCPGGNRFRHVASSYSRVLTVGQHRRNLPPPPRVRPRDLDARRRHRGPDRPARLHPGHYGDGDRGRGALAGRAPEARRPQPHPADGWHRPLPTVPPAVA
ncbi:hypothetical protein VTK73DRAFT_5081 [Phialemonium thermophilum]|uniref:Uncharacterized protein n=1 Tax=Phialemonium thermophilum TaxID=223376 RepID=A0ABR3V3N2_9PEZI